MKKVLTTLLAAFSISCTYAQQTVGLFTHTTAAEDGYVLFAPLFAKTTYLIDKCGKEVHNWQSTATPGLSVYLLPNGSLLRPSSSGNTIFNVGGTGGNIEILDWAGNVTWSYSISSTTECQHHDVCPMPNGNILVVSWELKSAAEAIAAGRNPANVGATIWSEKIMEITPVGTDSATLVWQWRVWDHLIQDFDPAMANYGVVADHPELININYYSGNPTNPDWLHMNSVAYNADLDQVMMCSYYFDELWVIDHSTTVREASTHAGGGHNVGGDMLYRWGNPQAYGRGSAINKELFSPHDPHWIANNLPDKGKIIIYNNGQNRPLGNYSTVDIIDPPIDGAGNYALPSAAPYGPLSIYWQYKAPHPLDFYSSIISGAERLSNWNTLICEGTKGKLFEVDTAGNIVWEYVNPVVGLAPISQGTVPGQNYVFRCQQYPASYSGFNGHILTSGPPIELNPISIPCFLSSNGVPNNYKGDIGIKAANPFNRQIVLTSDLDSRNVHATLINSLGMVCGDWNLYLAQGTPATIPTQSSLAQGVYLLRVDDGTRQHTIKLMHD